MKAFLVLPFLLLLLAGNSQESALSRKRSIRGLNTTLQTNFNGTFQIKNPCTNADLETSSYIASHEFHHHIKENNWSDYLQKCSAIINSFLRGVGNLVRVNSKQNTAFNFHVNTSISQKQDIGDCEKQCESLPTIVIEAESCELPPPCKSSKKVRNEYLLKQDVRRLDKTPDNYLTTPQFPTEDTFKEGFDVEEKQQKVQKLINYGSKDNITPISRFSTSTVQAGTGETNDLSQTTTKSEFSGTSGRDFTASITLKPEDEFTTSLTPAPWQDYSESSLYANPETQDYPYSTPTISEYQTTRRPSFSDEKMIDDQYEVDQKRNFGDLREEILDQAPVRSSTSKSESIRVEKGFKYQHNIPLGLGEPDYIEETIPPSERFQPADSQTPYPQILDRYPLQQQTQSIDDMTINEASKQILPQGDSLGYPPRPETSYTSQTNEHKYLTTPSDDCLTTPPSNPSTPENDFHPPREKFSTELPPKTSNFPEPQSSYPDVYTVGSEKPINNFYTPAAPKFRKNGKSSLPVDKLDEFSTTISPLESITIYDSDEDVFDDRLSSPTVDEESYIKSQSFPSSAPFPKDQNEKTAPNYSSTVSSEDYKNSDFESLKPTFMKPKSKAQLESDSLTLFQPTATYPEVDVPRFSDFENPSYPPIRNFERTTTPSPPVTYSENDFYTSTSENPMPSTLEPVAYSEASTQAFSKVEEQGSDDFVNPDQLARPMLEPTDYSEPSSQTFADFEEQRFDDFKNSDQQSRQSLERTATPPPPVTYPEEDFYSSDYPSTPENPPLPTSESVAYSRASSKAVVRVNKPGFNDFENPDQPERNFKPIRTSPRFLPEDELNPKFAVNRPKSTSPPLEAFESRAYAEASSQAAAEVEEQGFNGFENSSQSSLKPRLEQIAYAEASSQASARAVEAGINDFENPDQPSEVFESITTPPPPVTYPEDDFYPSTPENPPPSSFEPIIYSKALSQASTKVDEQGFNDYENPSKPPRPMLEETEYLESSPQPFSDLKEQRSRKSFERTRIPPPPVTYPTDDFYSSDYSSTSENPPPSTLEPIAYSEASSQAFAKVEEQGFDDFVSPDQPPSPVLEPTDYSEPSSQTFSDIEEQGFNDFDNPDQPPRQPFERTATPPAPVTYPEEDFYSSDYPSTPENPPLPTSEPIAYSKTSTRTTTKVEKQRFNDFENTDERPEAFEPITPPVTYSENSFYPSNYASTLENPTPSTPEPIAYSRASSQAFSKVEEQGFDDFVNPDQPARPMLEPTEYSEPSSQTFDEQRFNDFKNSDQQSRQTLERTATPPPPVAYHRDDFYSSDYPSTPENSTPSASESIAYSRALSQASTKTEEQGFNDFENPDQPETAFEPIDTASSPITNPEDDSYVLDNRRTLDYSPVFTRPPTPLNTFEPRTYAEASSEASAEVEEQSLNDFENPDQPSEAFESITTPPPPVTYPEDDFYSSTPENPPPSSFEPIAYSRASSQAAVRVDKPDINDFENPDQPRRNLEQIGTSPPSERTYPEDDFYPSDYPSTPENPPPLSFEPIAYSASSQASAIVEEPGFNDFENPDERPRAFEQVTPPAAHPKDDTYFLDSRRISGNPPVFGRSQTPSEILESSTSTEASSQAFPKVERPGFNDYENPTERAEAFEPTTPSLNHPESGFHPSDYPSTLENPAPSTFERINYSKTSSQTTTKVEEQDLNDFESSDQPPRPIFEPTPYSEPSSQTVADFEEPKFNDFENSDEQSRQSLERTRTPPPPVTYPRDDFYSSDYPSTPENTPFSTSESMANSRASSQAFSKVEEQGFDDFVSPDQPPRPMLEPTDYSEPSSQTFADFEEQRFNDFDNPDQPSRQPFERTATPPAPVTYPEEDFYSSDYPSTPENPPLPTSEPIAYSKTSTRTTTKVEKQRFNDFEIPDERPEAFEPITPPVTYSENSFYPSNYASTLENPTPSTPEPIAYSEASSLAKIEEQGFDDFVSPDQPRRPMLEPTEYSETSSQTFEEQRFDDFKNSDQQSRQTLERTATPPPPVTYPEEDFYSSDYPSTPENPPLPTSESVAYSEASSQASTKVEESSANDFENRDQPIRNFSPSSVTSPDDDFYRKSTPPFEVFEPTAYAEAESKVLDIQEPRLSNFENPDQSFERTATPPPPITYSEGDFYPSDYQREMGFEQSMTSDSEDHSVDYLPTTQSPDNLSFSSFKSQADAHPEYMYNQNEYNRPEPTDLPPEAKLPLWTKRPEEPQSLPADVENVDVVLSDAQSDRPFNQLASPQSQPPVDYSDERVSDRYSEKPLTPLDTISIPQPQSEEKTTPPSYQDYTSREEPFAGDSTPSGVKSPEEMLIYSPPFEPEPQPQPQPSSYIPGDKILASKTFENSETPSDLESQDRSSFGSTAGYTQSLDFLTTPTPFTDVTSFQTPLGLKPEKIMTDSQDNINTQETLFFGNNVSPQPEPTTAVKTYKEIVTTEYQTSPAPRPQPQTAMNNANQHSDDNLIGKIPGLFANQQQLVTSEPDFDLSTSESFSQSEQMTENHEKMTDYPIEEAPEPPVNYPNPNSFLPYNNQLRSQPIYRQPPPPQQESLMNYPSENFKQDVPPVREEESGPPLKDSRISSSRMEPEDNEWMWRSNEQVNDDSPRPPAPNSQIPPERFFHPEQNYNARERYFSQESRRESPPNFPPTNEPRRSFNPDFQRELITDSRTNSYNRPQSFDSFNSETKKTKFEEETETAEKQFGYQEKFFNNKRISEHMTDDRRFEPSENYHPSDRQYNFPQHPQQVEPFYEGFPPNTSYPDYEQIRPQNDFPAPGRDYPQYDQVFPNPPQFAHDEVIPPSMSNRPFDRRAPDVNENQYYPERAQRPEDYLPDREPNPLFRTLEDQIKIPLREPPPPEMPNESQRDYFQDNSSEWEGPNPPSPIPESQPVPDLSVPSNNPDRAANGRFNYMDRPLRKPFYEDRMRPVSTPERL